MTVPTPRPARRTALALAAALSFSLLGTAPALAAPAATTPATTPVAATVQTALLPTATSVTRYINAATWVRSGPGLRYRALTKLEAGTRVTATYHSNGWYRLGSGRYVSGTRLSTTAPATRTTVRGVTGAMVLTEAAKYKGIYYRSGGTSPSTGFDCSGYTQYVHKRLGISIPRTVAEQRRATTRISSPKPGDLVFFGTYHAAIYAGNGYIWDSGKPGIPVQKRKIWSYADVSYGRVAGVRH